MKRRELVRQLTTAGCQVLWFTRTRTVASRSMPAGGKSDVRHFFNGFARSLSKQARAFVGEGFWMIGELMPDFFLALGSMRRASDAARPKRGVKSGEVLEFGGDGADATANQPCQFDDARIAHVNPPEWNLATEVEDDDGFFARPVILSSSGHRRESVLPPHAVADVEDFGASSLAALEVVQLSKGALRIAVVGECFVVNLAVVIQ